jgi:polygalacturonase
VIQRSVIALISLISIFKLLRQLPMSTLKQCWIAVTLPLAAALFATTTRAEPTEITAALPVIPDAQFNLADFGGLGDSTSLNTDAFKNAVAAIAKAGGGHLNVPAGTYKTLPFTLTSHMDLHLEAGATIKAPTSFDEYGIPDPNQPLPAGDSGRGRTAPLISGTNLTDLAVTGTGTIDGSGAMFWIWSDKAARSGTTSFSTGRSA